MDSKVGVFALVVLLLIGIAFAGATIVGPSESIVTYMKKINANIVNGISTIAEVVFGQPTVYGDEKLVEATSDGTKYNVVFRKGFADQGQVCVPTKSSDYSGISDVSIVEICISGPNFGTGTDTGNWRFDNFAYVTAYFYKDNDSYLNQNWKNKYSLDCANLDIERAWSPDADEPEACALDSFSPSLKKFITLNTKSAIVADGTGGFHFDFTFITNGGTTYPSSK
ncbi:MAG: hypothetical protein WC821_04530 [archaeon]|jgi:hypothetical protein